MKKEINKKTGSVFDKWKDDPEYQKDYGKEFSELAISELMLAIMADDQKSVRKLAELTGLSANAIQNLKSGKAKDVKLKNFMSILAACGYHMELVKGDRRITYAIGA